MTLITADDIDNMHERLMRCDRQYAEGYTFVIANSRLYSGNRPDELSKMAEQCANFWDNRDDMPNTFALGAAAGLLKLAERGAA